MGIPGQSQKGEAGGQGLTGEKGEKGDMGPRGPVGEKGERGNTGPVDVPCCLGWFMCSWYGPFTPTADASALHSAKSAANEYVQSPPHNVQTPYYHTMITTAADQVQ